jgi:predicted amidohydrolase YtcJ
MSNRTSKYPFIPCLLTLVMSSIFSCGRPVPEDAADLVLTNANVVTVDPALPKAESVAVKGDRILAVGTNEEVGALIGDDTRVLDLEGKTVVPGMIDAHVHFSGIGARLMQIDATQASGKEDVIGMVADKVAQSSPGEWIRGRGWDQNKWPDKAFPTKEDLDAVAPQNPVYLGRVDGHAAWVNSKALEIAGITKDTPDPHGGQIIRDAQGKPTGTLIDNAFRMVAQHVPPETEAALKKAVQLSIQECLASGLTGVHEAGGNRETIELYEDLMKAGEFDFRIYELIRWPVDEQSLPHTYESLDTFLEKGPQIGLYDNRLTIRGIKMSIDGALGSRGAALLEPYADDPDNRGVMRLTEEEIYETILRGLEAGFQTAIHAIGDRANRVVLDAMEKALAETQVEDARLRIEHAQILHPDDVPRFAELGIIPSMQPTHCTTDMHWIADRVGEERSRYAYAWRTLLDSGVRIPGGSDAPVESVQPLLGIYAAVTRQDRQGWPEGGWHPGERVSREQALRMFTIDAAYAAFEEDIKGSLTPGKLADIVVLSKDIMTIPALEILETKVLMTILGGKIVFEYSDT